MTLQLKAEPQNIYFRCVEDSNEAIMISNKKGFLVYVNPAWTKIYGYSKEEAIGKTPRLLHSGMHEKTFYEQMWQSISNPETASWKGEVINKAKDGTLIPVILSITPYRELGEGEIAGYMGIALDIRQRKELEAEIAHQDRLASVGMLASGLAHEIGTPLGVIRGRAELMSMQTEDPKSLKSFEVIISQIDRISKMIRSLLRLSRNFGVSQLSRVELYELINETILLVQRSLEQANIKSMIELPKDLVVLGDSDRLSQILLNLIMNAIHAMEQKNKDQGVCNHILKFECIQSSESTLTLCISDTGCGIPKENLNKLFKPFFTTKGVGVGTGLGLAITSQLMREMKGEIHVKSELGCGAQFFLKFKKC